MIQIFVLYIFLFYSAFAFEIKSNKNSRLLKRSISLDEQFAYTQPIHFHISAKITERLGIEKAIDRLEHYTCLKFEEQEVKIESDGIDFKIGKNSEVKFKDKGEKYTIIKLDKKCLKKTGCVKHYLGLALGLQPETSRYDRDKYITMFENNLDKSFKSYYAKDNAYSTRIFNTGFDYGSIMNPNMTYGSKNRRYVFTSKKVTAYDFMMGQRKEFSHNDLKLINDIHCSELCASKKRGCNNNGYPSPFCGVCHCPEGYYGKYCENLRPSSDGCGNTRLRATKKKQKLFVKGEQRCFISIMSKPRTNVAIKVNYVKTEEAIPCLQTRSLEIKYRHDKGAAGLCLCGYVTNVKIPPTFSQALILYYGRSKHHEFEITYYAVDR